MSWVLSVFIAGLVFTAPGNLTNYYTENYFRGNTPQVVVSSPQSVTQGDETERIDKTFPLNPNGRVSVSNVNGSITIEGWDKNEVKLEAIKIANDKERLAQLDVRIDHKTDYLKIETHYGDWKNGNRNWNCNSNCRMEVQYKLMVPRNALLDEIETVNGSVSISNTTNVTNASAVNGSVKATNLRGAARIETVNGTSEVDFESLNADAKIALSTVNGRINLLIPSDSDATIKADSLNGTISNDFGLPVRKGKYVGRDLYGKVGDGKVKINLESVNGVLNIRRKQDGKNPKPVINLLNMNAKSDDEDDEDAVDVEIDSTSMAKMNKNIAKTVKESTKIAVAESIKIAEQAPKIAEMAMKEASKAIAESSKEMEKAQRDIERAQRIAQRDAERAGREIARNYTQGFDWNWSDSRGNSTKRIEEQVNSIPVKGVPRVTIDAKNCSVSVRGWDNNEVKYRVTKLVRGAFTPELDIKVKNTDSEVTINALVKGQKVKSVSGKYTETTITPEKDGEFTVLPENAVKIEVFVPKKSNLRILTDREIRVEGVSGNLDLSGNDGAINVRDSEGKLKLTAADALVRVIGFTGEIDSKTGDGSNFFEGDFAKFSAATGDGKIVLTLSEDADIDIETESEVFSEGFDLSEIEGGKRIGNGGKIYQIRADAGEIFVRNANTINAKY